MRFNTVIINQILATVLQINDATHNPIVTTKVMNHTFVSEFIILCHFSYTP